MDSIVIIVGLCRDKWEMCVCVCCIDVFIEV